MLIIFPAHRPPLHHRSWSPIYPSPIRIVEPHHRSYSTTKPFSNKFRYQIAASFVAKDCPYDPSHHVYHFNPKHRQLEPPLSFNQYLRLESGQDAFFVSGTKDSGTVAFGVADGVGGWVDSGVDPADFSHGFCGYMAQVARVYEPESPRQRLTARQLMQKGYENICHDGSVRAGGSTACVAVADPNGTLDVANLGDSGFLQLRLNAVHAYSEPQTHAFNTPFQLSLVPPSLAARMATYGGTQLSDLPRDADVTQHDLRHGDVLLFATDGVFDNLFHQDILRLASQVMLSTGAWVSSDAGGVRVADDLETHTEPTADQAGNPVTLQGMLATQIVGAAKQASVNTRVDGPFAKEVQKYFPHENWTGGKVDDICVVVAVVCEQQGDPKSKL